MVTSVREFCCFRQRIDHRLQTLKNFRNILGDARQETADNFKRRFLQLFVKKFGVDCFPVDQVERRQKFVVFACFDEEFCSKQNTESVDELMLALCEAGLNEMIEKVKQRRQITTTVGQR